MGDGMTFQFVRNGQAYRVTTQVGEGSPARVVLEPVELPQKEQPKTQEKK